MKLTKEETELLNKIIDSLYLTDDFGSNSEDDDCDYQITESIYSFLPLDIKEQIKIGCGASKAVIIPENCSCVIKTPLLGSWHYEEYYNEEEDCYDYDYDNPYFEEYCGASYEDAEIDSSDYCALEEYLSNIIEDAGMSAFFAKTEFFRLGNLDRYFYISEKCHYIDYSSKKASENSKTIAKSKRNNFTPGWRRMSTEIAAMFIDDYGEEAANKLFEFIADYDISDLHDSNIMISEKTGKIVIVDYSGFHD